MEKLVNSAFDFFAYALPGFCILSSFFILDETLNTSRDFLEFAGRLKAGSGIALLGLGYGVGFAVTPLGRMLYKWFQKTILFKKLDQWLGGKLEIYGENETGDFISDKFVLVREFSPNNFKYIESWHVYSLMSHNMAVAGLIALALIAIKIAWLQPPNREFWAAAAILTLLAVILFIYNAIKFNIWSANDHNAAVKKLLLKERAQRLAGAEKND